MKKSIVVLIVMALMTLVNWTSYGQKQNSSSLHSFISGSEANRVVDWHPVRIMSEARVLEIVGIKAAGKSITIGQPFAADDAWLDTLTFRVRNVSDKSITLLGFGVAFPEIKANDGVTPMFSITYNAESMRRDSGARKPLMPDEEIDLKLPEDQLAIMRRISIRTTGTANLSKVNILPGLATFEDGSSVGGLSLRRRVAKEP